MTIQTTTTKATTTTNVTTTTVITTITTPNFVNGDMNNDGITTIADIVLIQKALVKSDIDTELAMSIVDMNKDGKFNVFDLIIVKRMLLSRLV